jgi:DNA primase
MAGIDYRAVRASVTLTQVLDELGFVCVERRGAQVRGPCPIHRSKSDRSRSFSANLDKNAFRCFRCGASGNQLDLWCAVTQMDLHEATIMLCERLGVVVPYLNSPSREPNPSAKTPGTEKRNP